MDAMDIALNIRRQREAKGLTLEALATKARVTKGFLSQLENFRAMPSVPLLYKLAEALEVEPAALLSAPDKSPKYVFTKNGEGLQVEREHPESGFVYKALAKGKNSKTMEPFVLEIPPGASRKPVTSNGDEFIYLLEGEVDFHLGEEVFKLKPGDSLYFEGELPHYSASRSKKTSRMLVLYSITY